MPRADVYTCSVCGAVNPFNAQFHHRESLICATCGSNCRFRAIACALSWALRGVIEPVSRMDARKDVCGIGVSDSDAYASVFAQKFSYTNTYFHQNPYLNVEDLETFRKFGRIDFAVCSDVIEHTFRTPRKVLANFYEALSPGGVLIVSVPTYEMPYSIERYPTLRGYETLSEDRGFYVRVDPVVGQKYEDRDAVFHGGPGQVLEMRVIGHAEFLYDLQGVGFKTTLLPNEILTSFGADWPRLVERSDVPFVMDGRVIVAQRPV